MFFDEIPGAELIVIVKSASSSTTTVSGFV
jgi:hypothetical protein